MTDAINYVDVMVHGLFFMWQNGDNLELIAPSVNTGSSTKHHFLGGFRGRLQKLTGTVDWLNIGLIGKKPSSPTDGLKPSVLQFSLTDTQLGVWKSDPSIYEGRIVLPWPLEFYSLRCDDFGNSFKHLSPNVGANIDKYCKAYNRIGVITCLRYAYSSSLPAPNQNIHCYFQPCTKHSIAEVNDDLKLAGNCFSNCQNFDLEMDRSVGSIYTPPALSCPSTPPEAITDDCYSLDDDPLRPIDLCPPPHAEVFNVNPANCPNFYVRP